MKRDTSLQCHFWIKMLLDPKLNWSWGQWKSSRTRSIKVKVQVCWLLAPYLMCYLLSSWFTWVKHRSNEFTLNSTQINAISCLQGAALALLQLQLEAQVFSQGRSMRLHGMEGIESYKASVVKAQVSQQWGLKRTYKNFNPFILMRQDCSLQYIFSFPALSSFKNNGTFPKVLLGDFFSASETDERSSVSGWETNQVVWKETQSFWSHPNPSEIPSLPRWDRLG